MITSPNNATVRKISKLRKRRERERRRAFLIEGHRAIGAVLGSDIKVGVLVHTPGALERRSGLIDEARARGAKVHEVSVSVMAHLTSHDHPPDVLAVAPLRPAPAERALEAGAVVAISAVRDPSVAGGIMAAAAGAGAGAVVATEGTADLFGPVCVRAAAGAHFVLPVASVLASQIAARGTRVVVLDDDGIDASKADWSRPFVLVVHDGAVAFDGAEHVSVPAARGGVRAGLVARAAIALYEAMRA